MQASSRRPAPVRYRYRQADEEEESQPKAIDEDEQSEADEQPLPATSTSSFPAATSSTWFDQVNSNIGHAFASALKALKQQPALTAAVAGGIAATAAVLGVVIAASKRPSAGQKGSGKASGKHAAAKGKGSKKAAASVPGPNSKLKPTRNCVPLSDGSAVVVLRPIAADNSCLFNAVGYSMHHSMNRAPFLRQVVSREVSSDPQEYSAAFLGMDNAAYCAWITNPVHWGGGIELAILAAHYRREIAAWNLETGACHVFGEEKGYTKQVMVIYNGVHYDALAVAASPRADPDDDITEFNPRTKRGKMILAAAQQLVTLHRKGKLSHSEQQQQKEQQEKAAKDIATAAAAATGSSSQSAANGPVAAADPHSVTAAGSSTAAAAAAVAAGARLSCVDCGVQLFGVKDAQAHAEATGHTNFEELEDAS